MTECLAYAGFVGVHPAGLTLSELYRMAVGKAELLGGTSSEGESVAPYDPSVLESW